jgi:hypothetical protein
MFNIKFKIFAAAIFILGGLIAVNAQQPGTVIRANVPVAFILDDAEFPAGEYIIQRQPTPVSSRDALVLQGEGKTLFFNTVGSSSNMAARDTELVFDKVGDRYYLTQIHLKGETAFNEVPKTKAEKVYIAKRSAVQVVITNTGF